MNIRSLLFLSVALIIGCTSQPTTEDQNPIDTTGQNDTIAIIDTITVGDTTGFGRFDGDTAEGGACIWIAPYRRSDGTCVRGHWTSAPGEKCSRVGSVYQACPWNKELTTRMSERR